MIVPGYLNYFIFLLLPTLLGVYYSFTYWNYYTAPFAGLSNYINIITDNSLRTAITNTLIFAAVTTLFKVFFGMILAILLNRNLKSRNYLRTVYFSPVVLNNVVVAIIFQTIYHPSKGILNVFLKSIGLDILTFSWLTDPNLALYSCCAIEIWKWTGFTMVIILGGLQTIDKTYYEAADIDGVNWFQKFRHITLHLIMPAFNNALVLNLIGGLKIFDIIYASTKGGPGNATLVMNILAYNSFSQGRLGEASAAGVLLSIMVVLFATTGYSLLRRKEVEV
jgi:raffinose/stachyose/melibiose transport system permease protein